MFKVEMFDEESCITLEIKINEFIKNKEVVNVSLSTYAVGHRTWNRAIVLYKN